MEKKRMEAIRIVKVLLFTAAIIPALLGGTLAYCHNSFELSLFLIVTLGLILGQAGGDYIYYYLAQSNDNAAGRRKTPFRGWRPFFTESVLKYRSVLYAGLLCLAVDLGIGLYLTLKVGYPVLILACAGGLIAVFFTPLMNRGFKGVAIFLAFGPLPVMGVYYVLTKGISVEPVVASIAIGFLVTAVGYVKGANYELNEESESQLVIRIGKPRAAMLFSLAYLGIIAGVASGIMPRWTLLALLTVPLALSVIKVVNTRYSRVPEYMGAVIKTITTQSITGILLCVGYLISHAFEF
jgi:1,4-dihydroxy-2-naphthoate octaprenyltransferase